MKDFSIETPRLILRRFSEKDTASYFSITRCPAIKQYVSGAFPETIEVADELIKNYYLPADFIKDYYLILEEKATKKVVGAIMLTQNFSMQDYDLAYLISPDFRRKGYMKEALTYFLKFAELPSAPIFFTIEKDNIASIELIKTINGVTLFDNSSVYIFVFDPSK